MRKFFLSPRLCTHRGRRDLPTPCRLVADLSTPTLNPRLPQQRARESRVGEQDLREAQLLERPPYLRTPIPCSPDQSLSMTLHVSFHQPQSNGGGSAAVEDHRNAGGTRVGYAPSTPVTLVAPMRCFVADAPEFVLCLGVTE